VGVKQDGAVADEEATVAPILPSRDFERSTGFYARFGFTVASIYQPPDAYLILRRRELALHFFPHSISTRRVPMRAATFALRTSMPGMNAPGMPVLGQQASRVLSP
jgi:hypothetical protein